MFKIDEDEMEEQDAQDIEVGSSSLYLEQHGRGKDERFNTPPCTVNLQKKAIEEKHYEWNHEEITQLIEYWEAEDCLYNMRNADYKDKNERANALLRIQKKFEESGNSISVKDIATKMHGLRVYYGATRNKLEAMRRRSTPGVAGNPKVKWIYFEGLNFLQDFFHPREKTSNLEHNLSISHLQNAEDARASIKLSPARKRFKDFVPPSESIDNKEDIAVDAMISELPYPLEKRNFLHGGNGVQDRDTTVSETPPATDNLHIEDCSRSNNRNDICLGDATTSNTTQKPFIRNYSTDNSLANVNDHVGITRTTTNNQSDTPCFSFSEVRQTRPHDYLFCDMLAGQLQAIPDGESKELLKYEIYGLVLRKRFMQRSSF